MTPLNPIAYKLMFSIHQLLELPQDAGAVKPITDRIAKLCAKITGVDCDDDMNQWQDAETAHGVAISPIQAAKCVKEMLRTQVFMQGIYQALVDARKTQNETHILYAGTGPFGTLVLPLVGLLADKNLRLTLIDIHEENIASLEKMIDALGIRDAVEAVYCGDASTWTNPDHNEFDLIISETMNTLLRREPQVAIFCHLQKFLAAEGQFIPQRVVLDAWSISHKTLTSPEEKHYLGSFFSLDKLSVKNIEKGFSQKQGKTPMLKGVIKIPDNSIAGHTLMLNTYIQVYKHFCLKENQSSLNIPIYYKNLDIQPGTEIPYIYKLDGAPEFEFDLPKYLPDPHLAKFEQTGKLGIVHLHRLWQKTQLDIANSLDKNLLSKEWPIDALLIEELGGNSKEWMSYLYQSQLSFDAFERWVGEKVSRLNQQQVRAINQRLENRYEKIG